MSRLIKYVLIWCVFCAALIFPGECRAQTLRPHTPARRAILVSFDGFSEERFRQFADPISTPALWSLLNNGACAEAVRPAFPSITPSGHAAIWTGAYGNVNGIAAKVNGKFPLMQTTIMESVDGFTAAALRAEPLWISAGRQGLSVFGHMVTQSPSPPGYPDPYGKSAASARARLASRRVLALRNVRVMNGYNRLLAEAQMIHGDTMHGKSGDSWRGTEDLKSALPLKEFSWGFGSDSLHAILYGRHRYTSMVISQNRDVARGVRVQAQPVDTSSPRGRSLARFFSEPLSLTMGGRQTFAYVRLYELDSSAKSFSLFISEARSVEGNRSDVSRDYDRAVQGMVGNGASRLLKRGALGLILAKGGNGTAEWRYLESLELLTRQFMRGSEWGWKTFHPSLLLDYYPMPDEALHTWLGYADPITPDISEAVRAQAHAFLTRGYVLADLRFAALERFARADRNTLLVVTGEHGMRPTWLKFRPNGVLLEAGLLALDSFGRIDLSRTRAAAPSADWIKINRRQRRAGIVPDDSVESVLSAVESALLSARDAHGDPIVLRTWRPLGATDSLGIGGPAGGDIYFQVAKGIALSGDLKGPIIESDTPQGEHGYPSVERDMQPALCATGNAVRAVRFGVVRSIDAAPTISAWLGIKPPANSRGRSLLMDMSLAGWSR